SKFIAVGNIEHEKENQVFTLALLPLLRLPPDDSFYCYQLYLPAATFSSHQYGSHTLRRRDLSRVKNLSQFQILSQSQGFSEYIPTNQSFDRSPSPAEADASSSFSSCRVCTMNVSPSPTSQTLQLSAPPSSSTELATGNQSISVPPIDAQMSSIAQQRPAGAPIQPPYGAPIPQHMYPNPYPSFQPPPMAGGGGGGSALPPPPPHHGGWMQPMMQQVPGMMRPQQQQFMPYAPPAVYPTGHFPMPGNPNLNPRPSPGGILAVPNAAVNVNPHMVIPPPAASPVQQFVRPPGIQTELTPPGIESKSQPIQAEVKSNAAPNEAADAWTAHRSDTGVMYYYNAVSRVSTYEKPPGFKSEPQRVVSQPTPVSMENLTGTDWALVTTNDGKKYYYNSITKVSSWQVPNEVIELRKKQDELLKEQAMSVPPPPPDVSADTGSTPVSLSAPAINSGGRDAIALRGSSVPGASSALDMIKRKLQDSGSPVNSSHAPVSSGVATSDSKASKSVEAATAKGMQGENSKDKVKDINGDGNMSDSSSDSEDEDSGPTKEDCIIQFKEMLKERGVAPFSKWDKELPKILFDPRFKAIPSHSARRSLFEHYVKTRAEEERKEKRAAQKAAIEGFKQLLEEASEDIDQYTDYQTFRKKWGNDRRFEALDRKDREHLLNERVLSLKKAAKEKAQAERSATVASFKSMLRERGDITLQSRWTRVKDSLRNDPRYKTVKHEDREALFNEYLSDLKAAEEEADREIKAKRDEQEKLKERERELRKRKERDEQEMERVRLKIRRKEAVSSFQALLVETIKDPQASWTESKARLEKDPQARAAHPDLDPSEMERLFREHVKMLQERCLQDFKVLLTEVITIEAAANKTEDEKTVLDSWSTAKRLLKADPRYNKTPRKDREILWRRHADDMIKKQKAGGSSDQEDGKKHTDSKSRSSTDAAKNLSGSRRPQDRR
ncbi:Pre-mRNA-processing protein 40C, partial [Linum perenne]